MMNQNTRMYAIYRIVLFPVTLNDLTTLNHLIFYILRRGSYFRNRCRWLIR